MWHQQFFMERESPIEFYVFDYKPRFFMFSNSIMKYIHEYLCWLICSYNYSSFIFLLRKGHLIFFYIPSRSQECRLSRKTLKTLISSLIYLCLSISYRGPLLRPLPCTQKVRISRSRFDILSNALLAYSSSYFSQLYLVYLDRSPADCFGDHHWITNLLFDHSCHLSSCLIACYRIFASIVSFIRSSSACRSSSSLLCTCAPLHSSHGTGMSLSSSLIPRTPHIDILPDILYEYIPKVYWCNGLLVMGHREWTSTFPSSVTPPLCGWSIQLSTLLLVWLPCSCSSKAIVWPSSSDSVSTTPSCKSWERSACWSPTFRTAPISAVKSHILSQLLSFPLWWNLPSFLVCTPGTQLMKDISLVEVVRKTWNVIMKPVHFVTCGDVMFSGHTTLLVSICLVFLSSPPSWLGLVDLFQAHEQQDIECHRCARLCPCQWLYLWHYQSMFLFFDSSTSRVVSITHWMLLLPFSSL